MVNATGNNWIHTLGHLCAVLCSPPNVILAADSERPQALSWLGELRMSLNLLCPELGVPVTTNVP